MSDNPLTAADIVAALHSNDYSVDDRVVIVRALRDTTPGLAVVEPRDNGRIRAARATRQARLETIINALENSEFWQQSSGTTPKDLRTHLQFGDRHKALIEELHAYESLLTDNVRYQYFLGVEKSRAVVNAGRAIRGEAALTIKAHLDLIAESRAVTRRRRKTEEPSVPVAPKQ